MQEEKVIDVKKFIRETLPTFDVSFSSFESVSYYQEMLTDDYATIIETLLNSGEPEALGLPEPAWTRADLKRGVEQVLNMSDSLLSKIKFDLVADVQAIETPNE